VKDSIAALDVQDAIIDGEIVALDEKAAKLLAVYRPDYLFRAMIMRFLTRPDIAGTKNSVGHACWCRSIAESADSKLYPLGYRIRENFLTFGGHNRSGPGNIPENFLQSSENQS
jgi:hypothetical protein